MRNMRTSYRSVIIVLLISTLLLGACTWVIEPEQTEPEEAMSTGNQTFIQTVDIEERDGEYYATVTGWYPDACSTTDEIIQEVEGDAIHVTITSKRPADMMCAAVLTDFEEEFLLETDGLEAGEYTVVVNEDNAMTSFTVE